MKHGLVATLGLLGLLSGGFFLLDSRAAVSGDVVEERVDANLIRVRIDGRWEEFPLVPLAEHLCQSKNSLFERYCGDQVYAPDGAQ